MKRRLRILIVEDSALLAETLCDLLLTKGMEPVGPAATVDSALQLVARSAVDAAVLDVQLGSETSFPVARALQEKGVPFMFVAGSRFERIVPSDLEAAPLVEKPFKIPMLLRTLQSLLPK